VARGLVEQQSTGSLRRAFAVDMEHGRRWLAEIWSRASPHRVPLYKIAVVMLMASMAVDTGQKKGGLGGVTPPMVMMMVVTAVGLLLWRAPRDRVIIGCSVGIGLWAWAQVLSGQTLHSAIVIMSVLVFSLVVAGVASNNALFWFQIGATFVSPSLLAAAFYLGYWQTLWADRQTFLGFNANQLAFHLAIGVTMGVALVFRIKTFRWLMVVATLLLLPPLWATGSRSGLGLTLLISTLFLTMRAGHTKLAVFGMGGILAAGALVIFAFDTVVPQSLSESGILQRFSPAEMERGQHLRLALMLSGLDAFLEKPWLGHGMDAPRSLQWLAENMAYESPDATGVGTHNGYVDILIMGGAPLLAMYLLFYSQVGRRLWRARRRAAPHTKDVATLAFCLFLLCLADLFRGESFGKLSWWVLGIGLQTVFGTSQGVAKGNS
jgi:O-antigen ligase